MRTIIDIPERQLGALAEFCAREKLSRAEAVRRAIDALVRDSRVEKDEDAFGLWRVRKDVPEDGLDYQNRLRAEWDE